MKAAAAAGSPWQSLYRDARTTIAPSSQTALEMFRATAARNPDGVLLWYFDEPCTAGQLDGMSDALAVGLQRRGVVPGDRVALYLQNVPQVAMAVLAAWKCGAVIVPCNPMLRGHELTRVLSDSGSRVLICQEDLFADVVKAALPATPVQHTITTSPLDLLGVGRSRPALLADSARMRYPDASDLMQLVRAHARQSPVPVDIAGADPAFLVYTSGTTGVPKAAVNTHRNVVFATTVYQRWVGLTPADSILGLAPLSHITGLVGHLTLAMLTGCPLVLFYRFDPEVACRLAERRRTTFTVSAVTAFIAMMNCDAMSACDLSALTKVFTGGAPTPPVVLAQWFARTGTRIHPMYGLTEATSPTHMTPFGSAPPVDSVSGVVSIGVPVFNTACRVVAEDGRDAAPGQIGELVISGPQIVPAYWQKPIETQHTLSGGELRTGDIGFMDEQGWFYLLDRAKDVIVASGFKVWPREVEDVLYQHPAVREAAVVGVPDVYRGETVLAVVSLRADSEATPDEIRAFARGRIAAYKCPRIVEIVDDLPKTPSGKILRRKLREDWERARELPYAAADYRQPLARA
jgi:long-chain acyl-CoA synthetase